MQSKQTRGLQETEIGKIPVDWEVDKLENHLTIKGRIGWKGLKKSEFGKKGNVIINGPDIKHGTVNWEKCLRVPAWRYNESSEISVQTNDILLTKDGTIGKIAHITHLPEPATLASGIFLIRNNSIKLDQSFLYHYFNSDLFINLVKSRIEGSVIPHLYQRDIIKLLIPLPSMPEQHYIASILSSLETKIKLNKKMNKILEQTAQAIFKSWFVDFDGVTEFEDSELGNIPKGWKVDKISSVCDTFGGGTPSTTNPDYWNGRTHWLVPRDLTNSDKLFCISSERRITDLGLKNCSSQLHPENSIFMTSRATIGVFAINKVPTATNQGFIVSRPNNSNQLYYLLLNFSNRIDEFISHANGSTFLEISRGNFRELSILIPPIATLNTFHYKIKAFFDQRFENEKLIEVLTQIRDALLPKLMSGAIRV